MKVNTDPLVPLEVQMLVEPELKVTGFPEPPPVAAAV